MSEDIKKKNSQLNIDKENERTIEKETNLELDIDLDDEYVNNAFGEGIADDRKDGLKFDPEDEYTQGGLKIHRGPSRVLPLVPLRGLTIFPFMTLPFDVGRAKSVKAVEAAMEQDQEIILVTQIDSSVSEPNFNDVYKIGILAHVKQLMRVSGDMMRVLVEGIERVEIESFVKTEPYIRAQFHECYTDAIIRNDEGMGVPRENVQVEALFRTVISLFEEYAVASGRVGQETIMSLANMDSYSQAADVLCSHLPINTAAKQSILEELDEEQRLFKLMEMLRSEIDISFIERDIQVKVKSNMDKAQKDYFLREQLKVIRRELGESESGESEVEELRERLEKLQAPDRVKERVNKELKRMAKLQTGSPETGVIRNYVECILDLPWDVKTEESIDLPEAERILDRDHYGLEKVKERVIEYLAVKAMKNGLRGPIICLVGPPGVGKTSIAKAVAEAINRKYVRISLGGVSDEAELRGHRKTYIGAMPGRIINALIEAKSSNPLMLFDEIDKMKSDYKGDPASAMLEIMDGEQNNAFVDHYLEIPYDLSDVMFMTTANTLDTIPRPLLDRMEIIEVSGYTEEEKVQIAARHLVPKQLEAHGISQKAMSISEDAIRNIINHYTRESGVRNLEREIATVCRKAATEFVKENKKRITVGARKLTQMLGAKKYDHLAANKKPLVGVARGLAWTAVGGETLEIEVNIMDGTGKVEVTGSIGDVMKESAVAAVSYIRANMKKLKIVDEFYKTKDIHVHVPDGATPKDGPSAGITLATAIISALTDKPVRCDVAMTGEITIRGNVLAIGGLKEKSAAAHRAGINTVIIPKANIKDLEEIPDSVKNDIKFVPVENIGEVLKQTLV